MKDVVSLAYRYLTNAEFFNIYKPRGTEGGGGGQKYIDFPTSSISVRDWTEFFARVAGVTNSKRAQGPCWEVPLRSIGISGQGEVQRVTFYQRRHASMTIAAQGLETSQSNRVLAWHPAYGFPEPLDRTDRNQLPAGLAIYIARTKDNEIWAGWFKNSIDGFLPFESECAPLVTDMIEGRHEGDCGILSFESGKLLLDYSDISTPLRLGHAKSKSAPVPRPAIHVPAPTEPRPVSGKSVRESEESKRIYQGSSRSEDEILASLFSDDEIPGAEAESGGRYVASVRKRNEKAVKDLKELYGHTCQLTGTRFLFRKANGTYYTEAHHLVPLGMGGADNPLNIIIVSPLVHRMLHFASVTPIDLSKIQHIGDGTSFLDIKINGEPYRIRWKSAHVKKVQERNSG